MSTPKPATIALWPGGFFRYREIYPDGLPKMVAWQPPNGGSRPVPIGSQSIGVSLQPAIPRRVAPQQSPLPLHQSPTIVAQFQSSEAIKLSCSTSLRDAGKLALLVPSPTGVSSLLCTPGDISILRRQTWRLRMPSSTPKRVFNDEDVIASFDEQPIPIHGM